MNLLLNTQLPMPQIYDDAGKLEALPKHLYRYAEPSNAKGFINEFVDWVLREWSSRPYYQTERFGLRMDLSDLPIRSDYVLKEMQPTYRDFIHSLNGRHHFSPVAVNGTNCETIERDLYDFFHEAMRGEGVRYLTSAFPNLDAEEFWDRIFLEEFSGAREIDLMDRLCMEFGFFGRAAEPYTCLPPEVQSLNPGLFADWFFEDFKFARSSEHPSFFPPRTLH